MLARLDLPKIAGASEDDDDYSGGVGSRLWSSLSEVFGERVTKSNFYTVLRRQTRKLAEASNGYERGSKQL